MTKVFIAGHGRMSLSGPITVPAGVTLHWAVPPRYNGSGGLSRALLSKAYQTWAGSNAAGSPYYEHFLCPDLAGIMVTKGEALKAGDWDNNNTYLLQPRLNFTVTLSSIILHLKRKFGTPLEIYWTCCRSPVAQPSYRIRFYDHGRVTDQTAEGNVVADPGTIFGAITKPGKKPLNRVEAFDFPTGKTAVCITNIDGGVTMLGKSDPAVSVQLSWPGVHEASKPVVGLKGSQDF
jgi:hypothetical protein